MNMSLKHALLAGTLLLVAVPGARADQKAELLLRQVAARTRVTKTLTADLELTMRGEGVAHPLRSTGTVRLMKPNYARITLAGAHEQVIAADGKSVYVLLPKNNNQYRQLAADPNGRNIEALWAYPIRYFFNSSLDSFAPFGKGPGVKLRYVGRQRIGGTTVEVVTVTGEKPTPHLLTLFIGPDKLLHRVRVQTKQGGEAGTLDAALSKVRTGTPLSAASFAYVLPETATRYEPPSYGALVPLGKAAPAFRLPTPDNGTLALENTLKGKKAVLINFWFVT